MNDNEQRFLDWLHQQLHSDLGQLEKANQQLRDIQKYITQLESNVACYQKAIAQFEAISKEDRFQEQLAYLMLQEEKYEPQKQQAFLEPRKEGREASSDVGLQQYIKPQYCTMRIEKAIFLALKKFKGVPVTAKTVALEIYDIGEESDESNLVLARARNCVGVYLRNGLQSHKKWRKVSRGLYAISVNEVH